MPKQNDFLLQWCFHSTLDKPSLRRLWLWARGIELHGWPHSQNICSKDKVPEGPDHALPIFITLASSTWSGSYSTSVEWRKQNLTGGLFQNSTHTLSSLPIQCKCIVEFNIMLVSQITRRQHFQCFHQLHHCIIVLLARGPKVRRRGNTDLHRLCYINTGQPFLTESI